MTTPFAVVATPSEMTRRPSGSVIGPVHVVVGGAALPSASWHDFPVVVLTWWCDAVARRRRRMVLDFIDGPCSLRLELAATAVATIWFVDGDVERPCGVASLDEVRRTILHAAEEVLLECQRRAWTAADTRQLAHARERLARATGART